MSKIYYLKNRNDLLGTIKYPECEFTPIGNPSIPFGLFCGKLNPSKDEVLNFLKHQVVEEHNQGIEIIMKSLGCVAYSLEVLLDATLGITNDNTFWLVPEDKLHWDYETFHTKSNSQMWTATLDTNTWKIIPPIIKDARKITEEEIRKEMANRGIVINKKIDYNIKLIK